MYSKDAYRSLLQLALSEGYQFINFFDERPEEAKCIYLRHDVDWSLKMAVEMAEINHSLGISATFFILLRGHTYNFFDQRTLQEVRAIHALGQRIGLHYALPTIIPTEDDAFTALIAKDYETFSKEMPEVDPIFAWHNTTPEVIEWGLKREIDGLLNVYSPPFFRSIPYYSDSLGRYTIPEFEAIIREGHQAMQLLFHPGIWVGGGETALEINPHLWRAIIRNAEPDPTGLNPAFAHHLPRHIDDETMKEIVSIIELAE